jgi:hypothetical protein
LVLTYCVQKFQGHQIQIRHRAGIVLFVREKAQEQSHQEIKTFTQSFFDQHQEEDSIAVERLR